MTTAMTSLQLASFWILPQVNNVAAYRINFILDHPQWVGSLLMKHMLDISPRVQRLIVRSFPYLPFNVEYKMGTDIQVADALS